MYEIAPVNASRYIRRCPRVRSPSTCDMVTANGYYLMVLIAIDASARFLTKSASGCSRKHFESTDDITSELLRETFLEIGVSNG